MPALVLAALLLSIPAPAGQIRGSVVDATAGTLKRAFVKVRDAAATVALLAGDETARFQTKELCPGSYTLTVWQQGFRAREVKGVVVREADITDLGTIRLDVSGCDAPGVNCDYFGLKRPERPTSRGSMTLKLQCAGDVEAGKVYCAGEQPAGQIRLSRGRDGIYLEPRNGAAMSAINSDAKFGETRVRLDGLGPGFDLWLRTRKGHVSHIFLTDDIEPMTKEVVLWYVTR